MKTKLIKAAKLIINLKIFKQIFCIMIYQMNSILIRKSGIIFKYFLSILLKIGPKKPCKEFFVSDWKAEGGRWKCSFCCTLKRIHPSAILVVSFSPFASFQKSCPANFALSRWEIHKGQFGKSRLNSSWLEFLVGPWSSIEKK